jgi:adenine-specific DNA-methyltransferase
VLNIENLTDKDLGIVLTPPKTAEYIVSKLGEIGKDKIVLDPCVGSGIFIEALLKSGVKQDHIFCYDINPKFKATINNIISNFKVLDTLLTITPKNNNKFDYIVGNPPYLNKASNYIKKNKNRLKKLYGKINAHETYSMFIVNSIWRLKEEGKLGFITSDSFLSLSTHTRLRKFILETCIINEILLAPKDLFSNQNVSINPLIIILTKCSGRINLEKRNKNVIRVIPRVSSEEEYWNPKTINLIEQKKYNLLPFNIFFVDVEESIIRLFERAPQLEKYVKGYIGMHTHDNQKYIAAIADYDLANTFKRRNNRINKEDKKYKILPRKILDSKTWKPYLKRGGSEQYYRPIIEALDWREEAIKNYDIPHNVPFEKEGLVISGVSSRLAARYMPVGCYWDSNKAIGFIIKDKSLSICYLLGLLNSSLYNYLAKGIINNTNSLQITGIHALPLILPDKRTKEEVENYVKEIIKKKQKDLKYDFTLQQKAIDNLIFKLYSNRFNLSINLKEKLDKQYSSYSSAPFKY